MTFSLPRHPGRGARYRIPAIGLSALLGLACSGGGDQEEPDPGSGPPLDPAAESERPPIGSGARVLPAVLSIRDALEIRGSWWILDRRSLRVHQLEPGGEVVRSIGREGDGPGEFRRPAALLRFGEGFGVVDESGGRLDIFDSDGGFIERRAPPSTSCGGPSVVIGAGGSEADRTHYLLAVRCTSAPSGSVRVLVEQFEGSLATGALLELELMDLATGAGGALAAPLFAARGGTIALGSSMERCLKVLRSASGPDDLCNASATALPLPEAEVRRFDSLRSALAARLPGIRLPTPERMPFFEAIFLDDRAIHFRTVLGTHRRAIERIPLSGGAAERLPLPLHELSWVGDTSVLLGWEREDGTALLVLPLPTLPAGTP